MSLGFRRPLPPVQRVRLEGGPLHGQVRSVRRGAQHQLLRSGDHDRYYRYARVNGQWRYAPYVGDTYVIQKEKKA